MYRLSLVMFLGWAGYRTQQYPAVQGFITSNVNPRPALNISFQVIFYQSIVTCTLCIIQTIWLWNVPTGLWWFWLVSRHWWIALQYYFNHRLGASDNYTFFRKNNILTADLQFIISMHIACPILWGYLEGHVYFALGYWLQLKKNLSLVTEYPY